MEATLGRVVYYKSFGSPNGEHKSQERVAIITQVHPDSDLVDLCVFNPTGFHFNPNVTQGSNGGQWDWMPYQKSQNAKFCVSADSVDPNKQAAEEKLRHLESYLHLLYEAQRNGTDVGKEISETLQTYKSLI